MMKGYIKHFIKDESGMTFDPFAMRIVMVLALFLIIRAVVITLMAFF